MKKVAGDGLAGNGGSRLGQPSPVREKKKKKKKTGVCVGVLISF
jgi:hypothetical protein